MEVLVTGGNGFVGRHLIAALLARGDQVRVLALPEESTGALDQRVEVHRGDVCRPETLRPPMEGVDGVVHLAAMMHVWRPLRDYRAVNVAGTENVCRAARAASVARVVHMSSTSVYGMAWKTPVREFFPFSPFPDPYPVSKAEADRAVQRMVMNEGVPAVIVRPDQIFGPGDVLHFGAMANRLRGGRGIVVGRGDNVVPMVYVSDVVRALQAALDHPSAVGEAFNIGAPAPLTQYEILAAIASEIGAPRPRVHVPYCALDALAYTAERVARWRGGHHRPPITRLGVAFLGTDVRYAIDKAEAQLGFAPEVSVRAGIGLAADWYLRARADGDPVVHPCVAMSGAA
jgi:nucleoside-diphosphate-sugar epimerase